MGLWNVLCPCCSSSSSSESEYITPSIEERRQQSEAAALRRAEEQQHRGIKDPEKVRRLQERSAEVERRMEEAEKNYQGSSEAGLKWQMN